jgi:hypothetical protein
LDLQHEEDFIVTFFIDGFADVLYSSSTNRNIYTRLTSNTIRNSDSTSHIDCYSPTDLLANA